MSAMCSRQARSSPGSTPRTSRTRCARRKPTSRRLEAVLTQARLTFWRQQELLKDGWTPRAKFDEAQQALRDRPGPGRLRSGTAAHRAGSAELHRSCPPMRPGAVTAVGAEPGEVVQAGQMIVQLARQGGRDAVFDVPEQLIRTGPRDPLVRDRPHQRPAACRATGRVREVAPQADAATRTFQVKVGIIDPPEAMRLGSTVTGRIKLSAPPGVELPASALTEANGRPAVWVVDPQSQTVSLRRRGCRRDTTRRSVVDLAGAGNRRGRRHRRGAGAAPGPEGPPAGSRADEALQPLRMGDPAPFPGDLFHARHRRRGHRVLPPARAQRGSGLHRSRPWWCKPHGRAPPSATRSSRSPTASSASCRKRRAWTT